jgi:hypothetical protein
LKVGRRELFSSRIIFKILRPKYFTKFIKIEISLQLGS